MPEEHVTVERHHHWSRRRLAGVPRHHVPVLGEPPECSDRRSGPYGSVTNHSEYASLPISSSETSWNS